MSYDVNEQNLNEFNRFENLKLTLDLQKTRVFLNKITGSAVPPFLVMPKADQILRKFILDPITRNHILLALVHDEVTLENAEDYHEEERDADNTPQEECEEVALHIDKIKFRIKNILKETLSGVSKYMRPQDEVLDSVFYVLGKESLESLDSVGLFISRAFSDLFVKNATIVDKFVSFNLLVTKFEAYLKKLLYLMNGEEVKPRYEGQDVTWKDVIHAVSPLWALKNNRNDEYQKLYQYLMLIKGWRNDESHISPTASEQEVDAAIKIIVTMYFYATGSCITELEMAGHDVDDVARTAPYILPEDNEEYSAFAAEDELQY